MTPCWSVTGFKGKAFVDFQHEVTSEDVALAAREGFVSVEHLKRYTTLGMGTDQGRTSNINGLAILAAVTNRPMSDVGTTMFRPPYTPVSFGALVGRHRGKQFKPMRLTSGHGWAVERGATFVEVGQWLRAQYFAQRGEVDWLETVVREARGVRESVGVCDVSTLGKIDIQGADAAAFLDRVYINNFSSLPVGKTRYGVMLREDGLVMDDGTTAHLSPGHYVMSTTTVNAGKVMQHLEHVRQVIWPELDVRVVSITEQWAQYAVAGPNSRSLLERLLGDAIDTSNGAFPHLACAEFSWRGMSARLFRVSFSGELAFELAVPARFGDATIRAIMAAGEPWNVVPYGTEALGVMRIEKGHVAGNELNGMTTAADLGLGRLMSSKKDFIGAVLARRPGLVDLDRPTLVGIKPVDRSKRLHAGAHFLSIGAKTALSNDQGYVTSVAFSPMLNHWIGLGLLARGPSRVGERARIRSAARGGDGGRDRLAGVFRSRGCEVERMMRMNKSRDEWAPRAAFSDLPIEPSSGAGVITRDRDGLGIASVLARRGRHEVFTAKCRQHFGVELLPGPRRSVATDIAFVATGPGAWLATREDAANGFALELTEAFGDCAAIADQSDGHAVLRLSGPKTREALCKLVPIDLHPCAFAIGDVAVTLAAHVGVTLWRLPDEPEGHSVFEIAIYRSLAASFWTALSESAAEFGFGRVSVGASPSHRVHDPDVSKRRVFQG